MKRVKRYVVDKHSPHTIYELHPKYGWVVFCEYDTPELAKDEARKLNKIK